MPSGSENGRRLPWWGRTPFRQSLAACASATLLAFVALCVPTTLIGFGVLFKSSQPFMFFVGLGAVGLSPVLAAFALHLVGDLEERCKTAREAERLYTRMRRRARAHLSIAEADGQAGALTRTDP